MYTQAYGESSQDSVGDGDLKPAPQTPLRTQTAHNDQSNWKDTSLSPLPSYSSHHPSYTSSEGSHRRRGLSFTEASRSSADLARLDQGMQGKLHSMVGRYERLLETQLMQQQQYYQAKLSKETAHVLYESIKAHMTSRNDNKTTTASQANNNQKGRNSDQYSNLTGALNASESDAVSLDDYDLLSEADVDELVALKIDISTLECDLLQLQESIREGQKKGTRLKKQNNTLIKLQQHHQKQLTEVEQTQKDETIAFQNAVSHDFYELY